MPNKKVDYYKEEKAKVVLNGKVVGYQWLDVRYRDVTSPLGKIETEVTIETVIGKMILKKKK